MTATQEPTESTTTTTTTTAPDAEPPSAPTTTPEPSTQTGDAATSDTDVIDGLSMELQASGGTGKLDGALVAPPPS